MVSCVRYYCCWCCEEEEGGGEDGPSRREAEQPLLLPQHEPWQPSGEYATSADSLFLGAQAYLRNVSKAFQTHFANDEEVTRAWNSLTWPDIISAVFRMTRYRERRLALGKVDIPLPFDSQPELSCSTVRDWGFFANAAYLESDHALRTELLRERNYQLVALEPKVGVLEPAHYLAMSNTNKTVVLAVKGTSSSSDWLTNLFIAKEELRISEEGDFGIHAGVLHAARFILNRMGGLLQRAFYDAGFEIVLVGHSLGAGVASALAILLREELRMERVTCYAFAPPPAFSLLLSHRARAYVTSVVNNDDAIPRTGVAQLKSFALGVKSLCTLKDQTAHGDWNEVERELDGMQWGEMLQTFAQGKLEEKYNTFVPGRVLFLYERRRKVESAAAAAGEEEEEVVVGAREISCEAPTLRISIVSTKMVSDHGIDSYLLRLERAAVLAV